MKGCDQLKAGAIKGCVECGLCHKADPPGDGPDPEMTDKEWDWEARITPH